MACPGLDPRHGSPCAHCLGKKMTSYVIGYLQIVLWILGLVGLIASADKMQTVQVILGSIFGIVSLAFSVLLLIGLHTNRRSYIKTYLIFCAVITTLLTVGLLATLFTEPSRLGFKGFLSNFIIISLYIASFIIVRSYYIVTYS